MKRILSFILVQLLVISMIPLFNVFAVVEWTAPTLTLSTSFDLASNTVTATVGISGYDALGALDFKLGYNTAKVTYKSHTSNGILTGTNATINDVSASGYVSAGWTTTDNIDGDSGSAATILVVTFDVVSGQSGSAAFSLTGCSFNDFSGENETPGSLVPISSVTLPVAVTAIDVSITPPEKGEMPVRIVSGTGWTGTVAWTPAIFSKFVGGTEYTADVTLIPTADYKFSSPAVKLNGVNISTYNYSAAEITFSNKFEATDNEDLAISDQTLGGSLKVGDFYTAAINTTGGTGTKTFTITSGTLPTLLSLNPTTGVISGTPNAYKASITDVTVKVTDSVNTFGVTAVITIPAIVKDDATFPALPGKTAVYGSILSTVILPTGYTWIDGTVSVGNAGTNFFPAKYIAPENNVDVTGYVSVTITGKLLTVNGATAAARKYNGTAAVSITAVSLGGIISSDNVSVNVTGAVGTVSSVNPGTYTSVNLSGLTLIGSKAGNYTINTTAAGVPASVTVSKADAPSVSQQELSFTRTTATTGNTLDIKPLLPSDRGTTAYGAPASADLYTKNLSVSTAGVLTFDTATAASAVIENITVHVTMQNYSNSTVTVKVSLLNQTVPTGTPAVTGTMIYGQKLSTLTIAVIMKDGATTVPGSIAWDNPNSIPIVGAAAQAWTFTPTDISKYATVKSNVAITVAKATPVIVLSDKSSEYTGSAVEIGIAAVTLVNGETYSGTVTYKYYTDLACTIPTSTASGAAASGSAPKNIGTYYVKASVIFIAPGNYNEATGNTATFKILASGSYTVTATAGKGGIVTPKQTFVSSGGDVTIVITPDDGYIVSDVKVDGLSVGAVSEYKIENITKSHAVTVTFKIKDSAGVFAFTDVNKRDWYYNGILFVFNKGLMKGLTSAKFDPTGIMTRAMLVTVLWRMEGSPETKTLGSFSDVAAGQWYTEAINWAAENSVVLGYNNGTFGWNDYITREQMMVIFYRYSFYKDYDMTATDNLAGFTDVGSISDWALEAMKWAVGMSLITGMTRTTIAPAEHADRAQVATILMRYI